MCGKCEPMVAKGGMGLGGLCALLALVSKVSGFEPLGLGPRSFAGAAIILLLFAIAANTAHRHEGP